MTVESPQRPKLTWWRLVTCDFDRVVSPPSRVIVFRVGNCCSVTNTMEELRDKGGGKKQGCGQFESSALLGGIDRKRNG